MNTKLTLRMDETAVRKAKAEAQRRGKSVSGMVSEFFGSLTGHAATQEILPPVTRSLVGVLKHRSLSETDYRRHLREKYS